MATWTPDMTAPPRAARTAKDDDPPCADYDSVDECIADGFTHDECEQCDDLNMSAKRSGACSCGGAKKRQATHRLQGLTVHEISLVDHPANEMPFLQKSRAQVVIERARSAAQRARAEVTFKGAARAPEQWIVAKVLAIAVMKSESGAEVSTLLAVVAQPGVTDAQGDVMSAKTIADAERAYAAATPRCVRMQHEGGCVADERVRIAESFITPRDSVINGVAVKAGSWVVAIRVADPKILAAVRNGAIGGVSLGGVAQRTPVAEKNRPRALVWPGDVSDMNKSLGIVVQPRGAPSTTSFAPASANAPRQPASAADLFNANPQAAAAAPWPADLAKATVTKAERAATLERRAGLQRVAGAAHPPDLSAVVAAKRELRVDVGRRAGLDLAADAARKGRQRVDR
jgi:hypothetical protein